MTRSDLRCLKQNITEYEKKKKRFYDFLKHAPFSVFIYRITLENKQKFTVHLIYLYIYRVEYVYHLSIKNKKNTSALS